MDAFRRHRPPPTERFLGLFASPPGNLAASAHGTAGVELHEDEVLWTGVDSSSWNLSPAAAASPKSNALLSPSTTAASRSFRGISEGYIGILAALPDEQKKRAVRPTTSFQRSSSSMSPAPNGCASPPPPSSSFSSAPRMIPVARKPRHTDYALSDPGGGKIRYQSAPVDVPVGPTRQRSISADEAGRDDHPDDEEMLHPHELVAKKDAPVTTFSVLEGVGRTLKGRDLRRVRNAVWRQTGFVD